MKTLTFAALILALAANAAAQTQPDFQVTRAEAPPKVDGVLDDAVWTRAPLAMGEWASYNPTRGDKMPADYRTDIRIAYDDRFIYFAFHCFDNEPAKIRTNVSKRDSSFSDDWIAISLDSAGTGQAAYHLFSNPSGSQMDALNTSASGEQFDADMVWDSVAKTTTDGYIVEMQIPLQTLRFAGGDQVRMGLVFFRKISRIGVSYAWPEMLPGQWVFDRPAHLLFSNLKPRRLVELLPSATYSVRQERETPTKWQPADSDPNFGLNGKFGITSGITLDGTVNPDFSQVESDSFQIEVNQRFPVFFSEKRPFFMEGMGLFNLAGTGGDGNMRTAVHTRRIVDPIWGTKVTGTVGKTTFGVLNSMDESPQDIGDRGEAVAGRRKLTTIGRATYALRASDYIGAIVTDTEHSGRRNLVMGGDISIRPSSAQSVSATFLTSRTSVGSNFSSTEGAAAATGTSSQLMYGYETRRIVFGTQFEHTDRDFQMDTAFYNRTGFTTVWSFGDLSFYPKSKWLQRVHPFYFFRIGHDDVQDGSERVLNSGLRFNFTRQGFVNFSHIRGHETFKGERFDIGSDLNFFGNMQPVRWLGINTGFGFGPSIFYDEEDPFQGKQVYYNVGLSIQPNQHITQNIDYNQVRFDRADTGVRVYGVDIVNSRTTYQFDKHFLIRFLAQFDSSEKRVLTDLLASYEFVPGTVVHAGYGSLFEKDVTVGVPVDGVPVRLDDKYRSINRGLFFKASYLRRF